MHKQVVELQEQPINITKELKLLLSEGGTFRQTQKKNLTKTKVKHNNMLTYLLSIFFHRNLIVRFLGMFYKFLIPTYAQVQRREKEKKNCL